MTCVIHFQHRSKRKIQVRNLEAAALRVLSKMGRNLCELTLVLVDEEEMRTLNRDFVGSDQPTDVLAFPDETVDPASEKVYLGDVLLCIPIPEDNAAQSKHSLEKELMLLTVHGILHLLGYDHDRPKRKSEMWELQETILKELGVELQII